jgi:Divergent InlB B-repeat domain
MEETPMKSRGEKVMRINNSSATVGRRLRAFFGAALSIALLSLFFLAPETAHAQGAAMVGSSANFDVLNNTGEVAHGFEIQAEGISSADIYRIFGYWPALGGNVIRYGSGTTTDYPGGVYIRWTSPWDPATQSFPIGTPIPQNMTTVPGDSCWTVGMPNTYATAGCEHFGISSYKNPTRTTYRWLIADPNNPGSLIASPVPLSLPGPVWTVIQPAVVNNPPVVIAEVVAPPAPEPVLQFGDAQWVKVYKTEHPDEVQLEQLVGDNRAVVPQDPAQIEVSWNLLQQDPILGGHQKRKGKMANGGNLGNGSHAVVRRYEYYKYSGNYDPVTHEALCGGDGSCNAPLDGELGDAVGAQNAAANVNVPSLTVSTVGSGSISSSDKVIICGSKCFSNYAAGASVTLTASPSSGSVFTGWSGACSGAQTTCTLAVNDAITATATFAPVISFSVSVKNAGSVIGTPGGVLGTQINCGNSCSAKFTEGTAVTLTATPPAGKLFVNWSGACSGTSPTCTVTIAKGTSVQAVFSK